MSQKKVAFLVSGCGYLDGAEINEVVMAHLALKLKGFEVVAFSIEKTCLTHINHKTSQSLEGSVSMLEQSARIFRGEVKDLLEDRLALEEYSALVIPGGFGVAKNFCDFALKGTDAFIDPLIFETISLFQEAKKPILALCIAPALLGLVAHKQNKKLKMTLGSSDNEASLAMHSLGHEMSLVKVDDFCFDADHLIISTPAYMEEASLEEIWPGIQKSVEKLHSLVE